MSWSLYTRPEGITVEVWHVTDQNDTPEGAIAAVGQIVVREPIIFNGRPETASYVMDRVPDNWTHDGDLPADVPANPPGVTAISPHQHLYELGMPELKARAAHLGLELKEGAIKRDYVKAIATAESSSVATGAVEAGPPDPAPGKVVVVPSKAAMVVEDLSDDPPDPGYE